MGEAKVLCPVCKDAMQLPAGPTSKTAYCAKCKQTFLLRNKLAAPDDTISSWLSSGLEEGDEKEDMGSAVMPAVTGGETGKPAGDSHASRVPPVGGVRMVSLAQQGAMFEFWAESLKAPDFRVAMPRVCVHCLWRAHLRVHVVIFTNQLRDSVSLEAEHKAGHLSIPQDEIGNLYGEELLNALPRVPNVPAPADLPMPYWVCDLCNGAGEISGQIQVNPQSGHGVCRLFIRNLHVAASFFATAAGEGSADYAKLRDFVQHLQEDRWDALPSVVRHRMEQWFRASGGERFLAYVADRDLARSEDGMAGVVISSQRLIYHRVPIHQETPVKSEVLLHSRQNGDRSAVTVAAPDFKPRTINVDRGGLMMLKWALTRGHYKATWG